jgi:FkbM family methyltransferase
MQTDSLTRLLVRRLLAKVIHLLPAYALKCRLRAALLQRKDGLHESLLCEQGETVVMVGVHRIDTVMDWSTACGASGRVVLVEAVPLYLKNIRENLENHLNWHIDNISYVAKGVSSSAGTGSVEVGKQADYNKLADRGIEDNLPRDAFVAVETIALDTVDNILEQQGVAKANHVTLTISGMEVAALKGMTRTLQTPGLRRMALTLAISRRYGA